MIQFLQQQRKPSKMDMAPLIDVVFLLLIFFMLTFAIQGEGMDISLPQGQSEEVQKEESLTITIGEDSTIEVNNELIPVEKLQEILEQRLKGRLDKTVVIEAQRTTRYELFVKVLDVSRLAGAEGFSVVK
jgi:biopolymer transport protein ExbD